ncbi:MAG: TonB-dependent receptor [Crocinitomicaceae bacterium]|nr:TonB-dependent receptor family protein [Flavobacteriales bacterium]NQZ37706.1 TonB-dependent receptor [Crocinitomicaceae bacterium]
MINWKSLLLFASFFVTSFAWSQEMNVKGTVFDSTGTIPLHNAMAMAVRMKDSVLLGFTRTDENGEFELKGFPADTFALTIDHPDFDEKVYYILGHAENKEIVISSIIMPMGMQDIEEVVIYAYKDPIYYKGDTLVYVADSFATHEGAVVEDLLKKLPGLTVDKDGKITAQGEQISKVLVDGDEFFGSDPTIATKNLAADGIAEVQIYEKENEDGIGGSDEKIKVLDLKLKDSAKKGYFGRITGASDFALTPIGNNNEIGTSPFYEGELLLNKFNGAQKISIFALGSNTPRSNFGWGDMKKFGLENESGGGSRWNPGASGNTGGIPQTLMAGIYFSDKIGKNNKTKIGFNYSYYNNYLDATSASRSQYFLTDTSYVTDDSTRNITESQSHRINFNFETQIDSLTTFKIKPSIRFDQGRTTNTDISEFFDSNNAQTLGTFIESDNDSKGYSVDGYARLNRKFMKKKRELEIRYDLSYDKNNTDGSLDSRANYFSTTAENDSVVQSKINDNGNTNHYGTITYIEPIAKKLKLEIEYLYQYGFSDQNRLTLDKNSVTGLFTDTSTVFSNVFDNTRQQHRVGVGLLYESSKHTIHGTIRVRNIGIENVNRISQNVIKQSFDNVLPQFRYSFKPSMSKRFNVNYRTSSAQPSINDLQPVQDNTNPNRRQEGNPDLKPTYAHSLNLSFNNWSALSGRYVYAGAYGSLTNDAFSSETDYDIYGRTISRTINVDGNVSTYLYSGAGIPILGRKIEFRPQLNASYNRFTSYILGEENVTNNYGITPALDIDFNFFGDSLEFGINTSYSFNNAVSSLNGTTTPYSIENYGGYATLRLPNGWGIGTDGTFTRNVQPGGGFFSTSFFVLNAEVSKKFLKTQNLMISIVGNDILNQNINARREINGNIVTDYRTTIISRYFLLKATLRFNNRKAKEDDFKWH